MPALRNSAPCRDLVPASSSDPRSVVRFAACFQRAETSPSSSAGSARRKRHRSVGGRLALIHPIRAPVKACFSRPSRFGAGVAASTAGERGQIPRQQRLKALLEVPGLARSMSGKGPDQVESLGGPGTGGTGILAGNRRDDRSDGFMLPADEVSPGSGTRTSARAASWLFVKSVTRSSFNICDKAVTVWTGRRLLLPSILSRFEA